MNFTPGQIFTLQPYHLTSKIKELMITAQTPRLPDVT